MWNSGTKHILFLTALLFDIPLFHTAYNAFNTDLANKANLPIWDGPISQSYHDFHKKSVSVNESSDSFHH